MTLKKSLLIVGPSPDSKVQSIGGTATAFKLLFSTDFPKLFDCSFIDTTTPSPPPHFLFRFPLLLLRMIRFFFTVMVKQFSGVLFTVQSQIGFVFYALYVALPFRRATCILVLRGDLSKKFTGLYKYLIRFSVSRTDHVWVQGIGFETWMRHECLIPRDSFIVIPNWIKTADYGESWMEASKKTILFVGWLKKEKGVFDLFEAFSALASRYPDWELHFVGDGEDSSNLKTLVAASGEMNRVHFKGWLTGDGLKHAYRDAGCLVLPSYQEGFSNVVLEAMCVGRPVIVSDVGVNSELVQPDSGRRVPVADQAGLVRALEEIMESPELRRQMGTFNWHYVRDTYDVSVLSQKLIAKFQSVV